MIDNGKDGKCECKICGKSIDRVDEFAYQLKDGKQVSHFCRDCCKLGTTVWNGMTFEYLKLENKNG